MRAVPNATARGCGKEALYVRVGDKTIADLTRMNTAEAFRFFEYMEISPEENAIAEKILVEVRQRLKFLNDVGLHYLTLERLSATLSGGEAQRIQLATCLGSRLVGACYVLDEPSIGLHAGTRLGWCGSWKNCGTWGTRSSSWSMIPT